MKLDDLKATWRQEMEISQPLFSLRFKRLVQDVNKIERESTFGIAVMVALNIFFALFFVAISRIVELDWFQILNFVSIVVWFGYGNILFWRAHKSKIDDNWTLATRLSRSIELVEKQRNLIRNMFLKWILPMLLWVLITGYTSYAIKTGNFLPPIKYLSVAGLILALSIIAIWGATFAAKEKYKPMIEQLKQLKAQIEDNNNGNQQG